MNAPSLPSLLWEALRGLDQAHRDQGAGVGTLPSLEYWANLLRVLGQDGAERRQLPTLLRLSKRALRTNISAAVRHGWVREVPAGRGAPCVELSGSGAMAAQQWEQLRQRAERTWEGRAGEGAVKRLGGPLAALVSRLPLEHPHYPAGYGAADARVTGGNGQDWAPVTRGSGDTVPGLPLSALVSQALMGFALDYEDRASVALSLSALVIGRIPPGGRPRRGLGGGAGGISALVRHGYLHSEDGPDGPVLSLTSKGRNAADAYEGHVEAVMGAWAHELGAGTVRNVRLALESSRPQRNEGPSGPG